MFSSVMSKLVFAGLLYTVLSPSNAGFSIVNLSPLQIMSFFFCILHHDKRIDPYVKLGVTIRRRLQEFQQKQ